MSPDEMEGDLKEWGEEMEATDIGLNALKYPTGGQGEFSAHTGRPPQPDYFPKHQIKALNNAIWNLEDIYKKLLICLYIFRMSERRVGQEKVCDRSLVKKRLEEAKHLLVKSKYWRA